MFRSVIQQPIKKSFSRSGKSFRWFFSFFAACFVAFWFFWPAIVEAGAWVLAGTRWTDRDEQTYREFVKTLGESGYGSLNRFIRDPKANPLFSEEDKKLNLSPDCADFPYLVRAYVAYKLRLPFSYTSGITGKGRGDERYRNGNYPRSFKSFSDFVSPQQMFNQVVLVNSGYFRMSPEIENSDHYPVDISRESIRPGTIYYDPNGHVALVYHVAPDGRIRLIDAHPDKSISRPWFGSKFALGSRQQGGGFRQWRPIWLDSAGSVIRQTNHNLTDFSATDQYRSVFAFPGTNGLSYFDYVRAKLSGNGGKVKPAEELRQMMADLYEDVRYRALAVDICIKAGIHRKEHPGFLPWNIYGTDGEWEHYSTPSRDARLKVGFSEFFRKTVEMVQMAETGDPRLIYTGNSRQLAAELAAVYDAFSPQYSVGYVNSVGREVRLSFDDVVKRLFLMSFDPYHSIELRWGATGNELRTASDSPAKMRFFREEGRLRHQLERLYNCHTGLDLGPVNPPSIDARAWLAGYLNGPQAGSVMAKVPEYTVSKVLPSSEPEVPLLAEKQIPSALPPNPVRMTQTAPSSYQTGLPYSPETETVKVMARVDTPPGKTSGKDGQNSRQPPNSSKIGSNQQMFVFADRILSDVDMVLAKAFKPHGSAVARSDGETAEGDAEFGP